MFCLKVLVGAIKVTIVAVLDSGSGDTLIEEELFQIMGGTLTSSEVHQLHSMMQSSVPTVGRGVINIHIGHGIEQQSCIIISKEVTLSTPMVLGLDFMFRKLVVIKPMQLPNGGRVLKLIFEGLPIQVEQAPDGCIGEFSS